MAHETIFRRWDKLRDWIAAEREFLAWRTALEPARRSWQAMLDSSKDDALLLGVALALAQSWLEKRHMDIPQVDRDFIVLSCKAAQRRKHRRRALIGVLALAVVIGIPTLSFLAFLVYEKARLLPMFWDVSKSTLTAQAEKT